MLMKTILTTIEKDIHVFFIVANSFPKGIEAAHARFRQMINQNSGRSFYGISRPENHKIIYRAGTEESFPGESKKFNCDSLILKKGNYAAVTIENYAENLTGIGEAFDLILQRPDLDPQGYCVEHYLNEREVICMVRLKN